MEKEQHRARGTEMSFSSFTYSLPPMQKQRQKLIIFVYFTLPAKQGLFFFEKKRNLVVVGLGKCCYTRSNLAGFYLVPYMCMCV